MTFGQDKTIENIENGKPGDAYDENREWTVDNEASFIRNLYKADKLLGDVNYRMNMYILSAQHYTFLHTAIFMTPSIIITSVASFLSFSAATDPENSKKISLAVGFLGTLATIMTALQSAYKYDTMGETFKAAAAEYRLLNTKITSTMRSDRVYPEEWAKLWAEIEERMTELQKKMTVFPSAILVDKWRIEGKLNMPNGPGGGAFPPWLVRYQDDLNNDGIQQESDFSFVTDEVLAEWSEPVYMDDETDVTGSKASIRNEKKGHRPRYPLVVIEKIRTTRDAKEHAKDHNKTSAFGVDISIPLKGSTKAALKKRGVETLVDLKNVDDDVLDGIIDELITLDNPPMPVAWAVIEDKASEIRTYGFFCGPLRWFWPVKLNKRAKERIRRVNEASAELAISDAREAGPMSRKNRMSAARSQKMIDASR